MKITYNWLKEYVDIKLKVQELAHRLTMSGLEVTSMERLDGDWLIDIEVTTNRPDCLSLVGIAREVSAITGARLRLPKTQILSHRLYVRTKKAKSEVKIPFAVELQDKEGCPRYTGRVISGLKVGPSPKWLSSRLEAVGLRPVNNIVDITNFCLLEMGQPLHAFDFDKLKGAKIIVRKAKKAEKLVGIDGVARELEPTMLVIADEERPVALAGIMGGKDTEVTEETRTILLESAYFDPPTIRRTSQTLGVVSESSYRFERGVDLEGVLSTSDRATALILELAGGSLSSLVVDAGKRKLTRKSVTLRLSRLNQILGVQIPSGAVRSILNRLGLPTTIRKKAEVSGPRGGSKVKMPATHPSFEVLIPSWRQDLYREIDLIEEVARIWGYEKIPIQPPRIEPSATPVISLRMKIQNLARDILISMGLSECITYSLISKESLKSLQLQPQDAVRIKNPLSTEQELLRTSLVPGILAAIRWNLNRKLPDIKIFELGPVYNKGTSASAGSGALGPGEPIRLAIALVGARCDDWQRKRPPVDFFYLKGIIEVLLDRLGIEGYSVEQRPCAFLQTGLSAAIMVGEPSPAELALKPRQLLKEQAAGEVSDRRLQVGVFGRISEKVSAEFDIPNELFLGEIDLETLLPHIRLERAFSPLPRYPWVLRDVSMMVKQEIPLARIISAITEVGKALVSEVKFFDYYSGKQVLPGSKGLALSIRYQAEDRTLTDQEVNSLHSEISTQLSRRFGVQIR